MSAPFGRGAPRENFTRRTPRVISYPAALSDSLPRRRMHRPLRTALLVASLAALCGCAVGETTGGEPADDRGGITDSPSIDLVFEDLPPADDLVDGSDLDANEALDAGDDAPDDAPDALPMIDASDAPDEDVAVTVDAPCTGACSPGMIQACGRCGLQRCLDDCRWGTCASEGECVGGATRACGCGTQTCSPTCSWGACAGGGTCTPGMTRPCGNCGTQACTSACAWGACAGQGACAAGATQQGSCDACSRQTCGTNCQWGGCALRPGNACDYRSGTNTRACSACACGRQWCLNTCQWSTACTSCCTTCGGCQ